MTSTSIWNRAAAAKRSSTLYLVRSEGQFVMIAPMAVLALAFDLGSESIVRIVGETGGGDPGKACHLHFNRGPRLGVSSIDVYVRYPIAAEG